MSEALTPTVLPPATEAWGIGDVERGIEAGASAAIHPQPAPATLPPADFNQIIADAVAVYAAARAGGKSWWKSRGMWGAVVTLVSALGLPALMLLHAPPWAFLVLSAAIAGGGAAAGLGRMTAIGPIK